MTMTSEQLHKTLRHMENLIVGLEAASVSRHNEEDLGALRSLRHRRAWLRGLLAVRRVERANKIVSLDLWRSGFDLAATSQRQAGDPVPSAHAPHGVASPF